MTASPSPATNRVVVIGMLGTTRRRGSEHTVIGGRTATRGIVERFVLQVESPLGDPFALPLEVGATTPGREILDGANAGQPLVVEGEALLRTTVDARYARSAEDAGREVRELKLRVTGIRAPEENERDASSAVWLTGVISEPPRLIRHPDLRAVQLATTLLDIVIAEPSSYPGSRAVMTRHVQVPIAVPVEHDLAGLLYRPGNRVVIEGQLDCLLTPQRGDVVSEALTGLATQWEQQQEAFTLPEQRRAAERIYRRQRRQLMEAPRAIVLVGYVDGLDAALPMTLDEAMEQRRAFVRTLRERRARQGWEGNE